MKYVLEFSETGAKDVTFEGDALYDICAKIVKHFKGCDEWLPALLDLLNEITKAFIMWPESKPLEISGFREVDHHRFAITIRSVPKGAKAPEFELSK
jgi:hypothetical protein